MRRAEAKPSPLPFLVSLAQGLQGEHIPGCCSVDVQTGPALFQELPVKQESPQSRTRQARNAKGCSGGLHPLLTGSQPPGVASAPTPMLPGQSWQRRAGCCVFGCTVGLAWARSTQDSVNEQREYLKVSATQSPVCVHGAQPRSALGCHQLPHTRTATPVVLERFYESVPVPHNFLPVFVVFVKWHLEEGTNEAKLILHLVGKQNSQIVWILKWHMHVSLIKQKLT